MATVETYAELIKRLIREHAQIKPSYDNIVVEVICDDALGHYELMYAGWVGDRRVHGSALHIDLRDGKIWIQHDGTERGVATELMEAGVPAKDLVLAFHAPEDRKHTSFAVGECAVVEADASAKRGSALAQAQPPAGIGRHSRSA